MPSELEMSLDRSPAEYVAGESLEASVRIGPGTEWKEAWFEIGWHTSGMGDEDEGAVLYRSFEGEPLAAGIDQQFEIDLPHAPYSYNGTLIRLRWRARLVGVPRKGDDTIVEIPMVVGPVALSGGGDAWSTFGLDDGVSASEPTET